MPEKSKAAADQAKPEEKYKQLFNGLGKVGMQIAVYK